LEALNNSLNKTLPTMPINPQYADYCRCIRLIPLSPASGGPPVTAEVASSSLALGSNYFPQNQHHFFSL